MQKYTIRDYPVKIFGLPFIIRQEIRHLSDEVVEKIPNLACFDKRCPGAASGAQTLAGIVFEFRYCQFGMIATKYGTVTDSTPKKRVISFGGEMSPSFLLLKNYDHLRTQISPLDVVQYALAKKNYTASQLREVR